MPEYLAPGVFTEEIEIGPKPIEGVSTSTAGFAGVTERGPIAPKLITSIDSYERLYGGFIKESTLSYAITGFFSNGGKRCFVSRIAPNQLPSRLVLTSSSDVAVINVDAIGSGSWGKRIEIAIVNPTLDEQERNLFKIIIKYIPPPNSSHAKRTIEEIFDNVSAIPSDPDYFAKVVNGASNLVYLWQLNEGTPKFQFLDDGDPKFEPLGAPPDAPPSKPNDLVVRPLKENKIKLEWKPPLISKPEITGYLIERKKDGDAFENLETGEILTEPTFEDTGLDEGSTYSYRIIAKNEKGNSEPSNVAVATSSSLVSSSIPTNLTVTSQDGSDKLTLDWDAPSENGGSEIEEYFIQRKKGTGAFERLETDEEITETDFEDTELDEDSTYTYKIIAKNSNLESDPSRAVSAKVGSQSVPGSLKNPTVHSNDSKITLRWDPPIFSGGSKISEYKIERKIGEGEYSELEITAADSLKLEFEDSEVEDSTVYTYRIFSINSTGRSSPSPEVTGQLTSSAEPSDENPTLTDYQGVEFVVIDPANNTEVSRGKTGLKGLALMDDISLVCVPDESKVSGLQGAVINHCELLKDRFAIIQSTRSDSSRIGSLRPPRSSKYAAMYFPWINVPDPLTNRELLVPPGGHVTGIFARSDVDRGVHKAPANEVISNVFSSQLPIGKGEQEILNPRHVNVIRPFPGRGLVLYGARTTSTDPLWKYVNVRRLFIFVEKSIQRATQWVVFEPNNEKLWGRVNASIRQFLTTVWRTGALMGNTPDEAFFVKCDRETMTQNDIDNGRLVCVIGLAVTKPAEFVIFRIAQVQSGTSGLEEL